MWPFGKKRKQKEIYKLSLQGYGEFARDPLALRRAALIASSGHCWEWAKQAEAFESQLLELGNTDSVEANAQRAEWSMRQAELEGKLVEVAFKTFGFVPLDEQGHGVTELEALNALYDFLAWLDEKKD